MYVLVHHIWHSFACKPISLTIYCKGEIIPNHTPIYNQNFCGGGVAAKR